jgi:exonuclease III
MTLLEIKNLVLPEERAWLDAFLKNGFVDSFRFE